MRLEHEAEEAFVVNGEVVFFNPEVDRYGSVILLACWSEKLFIVRSSGRVFTGKLKREENERITVHQLENVFMDFRHCISCAKQYKQHIAVAGPMLPPSIIDISKSSGSAVTLQTLAFDVPSTCCFVKSALLFGYESGKVYARNNDSLLQLWGDFGNREPVVFIDCCIEEKEDGQVCCVAASGRVLWGKLQQPNVDSPTDVIIPGPVTAVCMLANKNLLHCTLRGCVYQTRLGNDSSNKMDFKQGRVTALLKLNDSQAVLVFANGLIHHTPHQQQDGKEERTLQQLFSELKQCEMDTSLDYVALEQRILSVNQALALQSSTAVLSLERGSPDTLFALKLTLPLQATDTRFVCHFQQGRWRESITLCKPKGTTHIYFRLPEPGNRHAMLPLDVSVVVVSGNSTSFAHMLIRKQRFDCLDTGELLQGDYLARFGAARSTFRVFVLAKNQVWTPNTRAVELLRSVLTGTGVTWAFAEQSPFRANATLLGDGSSVRLRLECDGEFVELSGVGRNELSAAALREALLRRCQAKEWFPSQQQVTGANLPLAVQREIFEADKMIKLAMDNNGERAREAIERTLSAWRQTRHVLM